MSRNGFDAQVLVHELRKLHCTQACIRKLSCYCICHRREAKQIVEIWERQFSLSPREQRIAFLYLANDIVQNNRLNGLEFVNEFWKVIPNALKDVVQNGGGADKKEALRVVDIWVERQVFGSRLRILRKGLMDLHSAELRYEQMQRVLTWQTESPLPNREIEEAPPEPESYAQMPGNVHSPIAREGVIGQSMGGDYPSNSNKRPRPDSDGPNSVTCYSPHPPPYPYPEPPPPPPLPFDD